MNNLENSIQINTPIYYELSSQQKSMLFLEKLNPGTSHNNIFISVRITKNIQVQQLEKTWDRIISRHPSLRTTYPIINNQTYQLIHPNWHIPVEIIETSNWSDNKLKEEIFKIIQQPFRLEQEFPLRLNLYSRSQQEHILLITIHHIAGDMWSFNLILRELQEFYQNNFEPENTNPLSYTHFVDWQKEILTSEKGEKHWHYWQQEFSQELPVLNLPKISENLVINNEPKDYYSVSLEEELVQQLKTFTKTRKTSLYKTLLSTYFVLLYRYTSEKELVVGSPMAGRWSKEIFQQTVGFFSNTTALKIEIINNPTFLDLLKQVEQKVSEAQQHQDYPFASLLERLNLPRDISLNPLFKVTFNWQKHKWQNNNKNHGLFFEPYLLLHQLERGEFIDLGVSVVESEENLQMNWFYKNNLFDSASIKRMVGHFETLLKGILTNPEQPICQLPLLTELEKQQILINWNNTKVEYPQDKCIHQLFEEQVAKTPDKIAVVFESKQLTYQELNGKANQLANYLRKLGVKPETLVGICLEKSLEMIIGILAILKVGGAYVPLDVSYPQERLNFMIENSQIPILLTQEKLANYLNFNCQNIVNIDKDWELIKQENKNNLVSLVKSNNLAYVIYTSGSTGQPKGVMIEHQSAVNIIHWRINQLEPSDLNAFAVTTSISFDLSVIQIFPSLMVGGKIIIIHDLSHFTRASQQEKITYFSAPPSIIEKYIADDKLSENIEAIGLGAEKVSYQLIEKLIRIPHIKRIYNSYGPTETTVGATSNLVFSRSSK